MPDYYENLDELLGLREEVMAYIEEDDYNNYDVCCLMNLYRSGIM